MHVMLDLETLSTKVGCIVLQIGAVPFELPGSNVVHKTTPPGTEKFKVNLNVLDQLLLGGRTDQSTIDWWKDRPEITLAGLSNPDPLTPKLALEAFAQWYRFVGGSRLWSHGAATDVPWLEAAMHRHGVVVPWYYRAPRDTRTLFDVAETMGWVKAIAEEPSHDALDDAIQQVKQVQDAWKWVLAIGGPLSKLGGDEVIRTGPDMDRFLSGGSPRVG